MRLLLPLVATSAILKPSDMAHQICATADDTIDNSLCLQQTFDKLSSAEANALVAERTICVDANYILSTASALAWAYDTISTGYNNRTEELWSSKLCRLAAWLS